MAKNSKKEAKCPEPKLRVVFIDRCARASKGGHRFSFRALAVGGNGRGKVGLGFGKSGEVATAIRKAEERAMPGMVQVAVEGRTIPHEVCGRYCGARVLLMPASPGTGIIAGKAIRAVLECAGIKDVVTKSLAADNPVNAVKATLDALMNLRLPEQVYRDRGLKMPKKTAAIILELPDFPGENPLALN